MKSLININWKWLLALVIIVYAVGVTGFLLPNFRGDIIGATPFNLLFCLLILLAAHKGNAPVLLLWAVFTGVGGYFVEVAGVKTGILFGEYEYGPALGFKIFDVPIMMMVNWLSLTYMSAILVSSLKSVWIKSILGALIMVAYDVFLEPVAVYFDMWTWSGGEIPLQNYLAWAVFGFVFQILFHRIPIKSQNKLVPWVFAIQLLFFLVVLLWK